MKEKFKAAILDDDCVFEELLKDKVVKTASKYDFDFAIVCYKELQEFEDCTNVVDLLFLDIEFPGQNCFKWLYRWQSAGRVANVVFVSAYDKYVFQSFESQPLAFVRKTHLDEDLERALAIYKKKRVILPIKVSVIEGKKSHLFEIDNILYLQGCGHYIEFHFIDGDIKIIRGKMSELEKILRGYGFVRIQIRYLINIRYIITVSSNCVRLKNRQEFQISPKYSKFMLEQLKIFIMKDDN